MPTRRSSLLFMSLAAVMPFVAPVWILPVSAKEKGNSGKTGNENGNRGRSGKGGGNSRSTGSAGQSAARSGSTVTVRHPNGLEESVIRGRYIMKDNKGRTIVNRRASPADRERLQAQQR